jgi:DNA-binding beta-propeller fold protein YncE
MAHAKNFRMYFVLVVLVVSAVVVILREHRPSFLRPNLHMDAYVSTDDGSLTVVDLAALRAVGKIAVGPGIADLREHSTRAEIWGVSDEGNYVFVVDCRTQQVTRIPVGPAPYSLEFSAKGERMYTTASGADQLVAVDVGSRQVIGRAHTNAEPVQARLTPDGKNIVVVNRRAAVMSIHDARTMQLLSAVGVVPQPDEVTILPDSSLAFVLSRTQKRLSVVDLERAVLVANLELAGMPTQMLLKPDGGELYVISPEAHGLQTANTWTHEMGDTMLLGFGPVSGILAPEALEMYVADKAAGRVVPLDVINRRVGKPITVGGAPAAMRFSPTEPDEVPPMLLVIDEASGDLAVIRTRTDSLLTLVPVGGKPERLAVKTF